MIMQCPPEDVAFLVGNTLSCTDDGAALLPVLQDPDMLSAITTLMTKGPIELRWLQSTKSWCSRV